MRELTIKKNLGIWIVLIGLILFCEKIQSQERYFYSGIDLQTNRTTQNINDEATTSAQRILIIDSPGKKGKEFQDTTIVVNSELTLYAALYNNGKYKSEAKVDWFWADTSNIPANLKDTSVYLGNGPSIIFKPTKSDTGFIFVKDLPAAPGDSTGTIKVINLEKLNISPAYSSQATITQGQHNILVTFRVQNVGSFSSAIQEANLQFIDSDSQIVTDHYSVYRIDTTTIIQAGQSRQFEFLVDVHATADTGLVFIDVQLMTGEAFYTDIEPRHRWLVQAPPRLNIDLIDALVEEVFPGQEDIFVMMYVSNKGGASVGDLNAGLSFWRNGQDISDQYDSRMSEANPQMIVGDSSVPINLIVRAKPLASYGTIVINGKISAQDVNTAIWYSDEGADRPASWLVTQTLAQVGIISTRIICPNVTANGNGEINIDQKYSIEVVVRNQGTEDVQEIRVRLSTDGQSRWLANASQMIPLLSKFQSDTIAYPLEAQAATIPAIENFMAQIDSATSIGGAKATINAAFDSLAQVKIFYPANLILKLESAFVHVPIGQTFDVIATVERTPENASFDATGRLSIMLPSFYQLISEKIDQPFQESEKVIWKVCAATMPRGPDTILVYISQIPHDKNEPEKLALAVVDSAYLMVEALDTFIKPTDISIIEPEGASDRIISTRQLFLVRARVQSQLIENSFIQITPPPNYSVLENAIKPISQDSATWWLRSPNLASTNPERIIIHAWGTVVNDTAKISSQPDSSLSVITIARANLKVAAEIIDPPSALQGRIAPGLLFQIKGAILNSGDAGVYGNQSLIIDVQDRNGFRVIGDTLLFVENQPAIWTIQTSEKLDVIPKIIKVRIIEIPYDENSNEEAYISIENQAADVQVYTAATAIQLMIRQLPEIASKAIAPGITEKMMGIEFTNLTNESGFPIQIKALKFTIEDRAGRPMSPQSAIAGFRVRSDESILGEAAPIFDNPIEISLTNPIYLDAQRKKQVFIEIDCHENLSEPFQINLKDHSSIVIESLFPVTLVDELKNPMANFNMRSYCPMMIENDLKRSFRNYPNPFGSPGRAQTHFIYYLAQDCELELKIYTLIGELVWSRWYGSSDPQGKQGLHQENDILWDGRNSRGNKVLNGVYIARIKTSYGEAALTKIAVIK